MPSGKKITHFLQSLGNNDKASVSLARIIGQKTQDIKNAFNAEAVWLTIRSSHHVDNWRIPRWHIDGYMYSPMSGLQYKSVFVLKGAGTLFCRLSEEGRGKFHVILDEQAQILQQYFAENRSHDDKQNYGRVPA